MVENWLKEDGAVIPAADANVEAADAELRLDPTSFFGSAPTRRVWRAGLLGAVRMAMPTCTESGQTAKATTDAGFPFYGLHLIERRADGDADAEGIRVTQTRATLTVGAGYAPPAADWEWPRPPSGAQGGGDAGGGSGGFSGGGGGAAEPMMTAEQARAAAAAEGLKLPRSSKTPSGYANVKEHKDGGYYATYNFNGKPKDALGGPYATPEQAALSYAREIGAEWAEREDDEYEQGVKRKEAQARAKKVEDETKEMTAEAVEALAAAEGLTLEKNSSQSGYRGVDTRDGGDGETPYEARTAGTEDFFGVYLYKFSTAAGAALAIAKEEVLERQRQEQKDAEEAAAEAAAAEMAAAAASRQPTEEALAVDSPASSSSPEPAAESPVAVAEPREVRAGKEFTVDVTLEQLGSMCDEAEVTDRTRSAMARAYYHGFGVMQTHNAPAAEPTATPEMEPTFKQIQKAAKEKYQQKQREEAAAAKAAAKAAEAEAKAAAKAAAAAAAKPAAKPAAPLTFEFTVPDNAKPGTVVTFVVPSGRT